MNSLAMIDIVSEKLQDPSYSSEVILEQLNRSQALIAQEIDFPDLQTTVELETVPEQEYIDLPDSFQKKVFRVHNNSKDKECHLLYTRNTLVESEDSVITSDSVRLVANEGKRLYIRGIPTEPESLSVSFYSKPQALTENSDSVPDFMPLTYIYDLLCCHTLAYFFSEIEDGVEGSKTNTLYYDSIYRGAKISVSHLLPDVSQPRKKMKRRFVFF